jgi:hypothetical protein
MTTRIWIILRFTRGRFALTPALWRTSSAISPRTGHGSSQLLEILSAISYISRACAFCAGDGATIFFSGLVGCQCHAARVYCDGQHFYWAVRLVFGNKRWS